MLTAFMAAVTGALALGAPAQADPALRFHSTQYDSPGSDTRTNSSLNAEWISLVNTGATAVNLKGWSVREAGGRVHTFGNVRVAAHGGRIWLHTGRGTDTATKVHWNSGNYIWNNTGDQATLRNAAGRNHDTCSWGRKTGRTHVTC